MEPPCKRQRTSPLEDIDRRLFETPLTFDKSHARNKHDQEFNQEIDLTPCISALAPKQTDQETLPSTSNSLLDKKTVPNVRTRSESPLTEHLLSRNKDIKQDPVISVPLCEAFLRVQNKLNDTADYIRDDMSGGQSKTSTTDTNVTVKEENKGISAYHSDFSQELKRRSIRLLPRTDKRQPENLDAFVRALRQQRSSPEPTELDKQKMPRRIMKAVNESTTLLTILPKLMQGDAILDDDRLLYVCNVSWKPSACIPKPLTGAKKLVCPQPDCTIGWFGTEAPFPDAVPNLGCYAAPLCGTTEVLFPSVAIEVKGDKGSVKIARLQNLHNGATMLWNLYQIRKSTGYENEFLNKVQVVTISVNDQCIEICYHWAAEENGRLLFLSKLFNNWTLESDDMESYVEARRCIRNAIDWILTETWVWIEGDLKLVEDRILSSAEQAQQQITPPGSTQVRGGKRKLSDSADGVAPSAAEG